MLSQSYKLSKACRSIGLSATTRSLNSRSYSTNLYASKVSLSNLKLNNPTFSKIDISLHTPQRTFSSVPIPENPIAHRTPNYMTTPIFYVNASPHLGHLYSMLIADVVGRWSRVNQRPTFFMCGTDEHGAKVQEASLKAGIENPLEFCNKVSQSFVESWKIFGMDYDAFVRTTEEDHKYSVQWMWSKLKENGFIYMGKHEGWYCKSDETFVPETQLVKNEAGEYTTPSGHSVEWISEDNYKFALSKFIPLLKDYYINNPHVISPPAMRSQVLSMLDSGMEDISISRLSSRLQWGIDVPDDEAHKVYVWLDALNIYLTGARLASKKVKFHGYSDLLNSKENNTIDISGPTNENTTTTSDASREILDKVNHLRETIKSDPYLKSISPFWPSSVQLIGKDIVKFHCIYWPAFLLGSGLPLPRHTISHSHWTVEGRKMSKSLGNVLSPQYLSDKFGVDNSRYGLLRIGNIAHDANFTESDLVSVVNNELSDALGNLSMRVTGKALLPSQLYPDALANARHLEEDGKFDITKPWYDESKLPEFNSQELEVQKKINTIYNLVDSAMAAGNVDVALGHILDIAHVANNMVQVAAPWNLIKDPSRSVELESCLYHAIEAVRVAAICLQCVVPESASLLLDRLSVHGTERCPEVHAKFGYRPAYIVEAKDGKVAQGSVYVPVPPFQKIEKPKENKIPPPAQKSKRQLEKERKAAQKLEQASKE